MTLSNTYNYYNEIHNEIIIFYNIRKYINYYNEIHTYYNEIHKAYYNDVLYINLL